MKTRHLVIAAFVILGITLAWQTWRRGRAEREVHRAWVAHQRAELEAAKWERAELASQNRLAALAMAFGKEIDAAREAGARIAMASHWQGRGSTTIKVRPTPADQAGEPGERTGEAAAEDPPADRATAAASTPGTTAEPAEIPIDVDVKVDDAVAIDDKGGIYVKKKVAAKLSTEGKDYPPGWFPVVPVPGNETAVDPKLQQAWEAAKNPPPKVALFRRPSQWRLGGSCIVGGGYTLVGGRGDAFVGCGYGVSF